MASALYIKKPQKTIRVHQRGGTKVMIMLFMMEADWAFRMHRSSFGFHCEAHVLIL